MNKCASIFILAEDKPQQRLIRKYFRERGFSQRQIQDIPVPVGETQNIGFVLKSYAVEVALQRNVAYSRGLVVVIDADDNTGEHRKTQLDEGLEAAGKMRRDAGEAIAIVVPRRNVETWIWHLEGNAVDETANYKGSPVRDGHNMAIVKRRFADYIVTGQEPFPDCPPSLQDARVELLRVPHR